MVANEQVLARLSIKPSSLNQVEQGLGVPSSAARCGLGDGNGSSLCVFVPALPHPPALQGV